MTEDEMVGWDHRLDGHGFGQMYDGMYLPVSVQFRSVQFSRLLSHVRLFVTP